MLVIVSDWHLTDHTTGMCMPAGAYQLFQERLVDMAYDASQRADGTYKPIDSFDLVLLGDVFDPLRSTQWTKEAKGDPQYARPWSDPNAAPFVDKLCQITNGIIRENSEALSVLQRIADGDGVSLPPATRDHRVDLRVSRDARSKNRVPVKVSIHYMIGNHDWYYGLPGAGFDQVRQRIVEAIHLSNPVTPFPYEPSEEPAVQQALSQHSVFARHGDFFDPYNFSAEHGRNHASMGDVLCVELFNRIGVQMKSELADQLPMEFFRDLDEMGSIRPEIMTPVWIASLLDRYQATESQREKVNEIWHAQLEEFLKLDVLYELNKPFQFDLVDAVKSILGLFHFVSLETLTNWSQILEKLEGLLGLINKGSHSPEFWATQETAYQNQQARFIVYGHTHKFTVYPLRSVKKNGKPFDQIYLNCGTWHPVHEICNAVSPKNGFIFHKTMSYLGFYRDHERKSRAYESWNGILDI